MDNVKKLRIICDELLLTDKEAALALDGIIELIEIKRRLKKYVDVSKHFGIPATASPEWVRRHLANSKQSQTR